MLNIIMPYKEHVGVGAYTTDDSYKKVPAQAVP